MDKQDEKNISMQKISECEHCEYIKYIEDEGIVLNYDSSRYPVNKRKKKQWE